MGRDYFQGFWGKNQLLRSLSGQKNESRPIFVFTSSVPNKYGYETYHAKHKVVLSPGLGFIFCGNNY
jgi:hypothetical protein